MSPSCSIINTRFGLVAVTVGELIDRRRVAVKNLGPILEGPGHVTGAALLGGGEVLVVLDPELPRGISPAAAAAWSAPPPDPGRRRFGRRAPAPLGDPERAGFDVEVAEGAREALMAMANGDFDAMVVDYSMPRSNGVELVRAMRAADVSVPIVMVSGVATQDEKRAAWEAGVDAYLDKFDLRQGVLTATLRRLIGSRGWSDAG